MIDLSQLKVAKVSEVPPGQLVLYAHGGQLLYAMRIESDNARERGLLILRADVGTGRGSEALLFWGVEVHQCLAIGKPTIAWEGDLSSIVVDARESSPVVITEAGPALIGRHVDMPAIGNLKAAFAVASGKQVPIVHQGARAFVNKWQIGVVGIGGEFCALVKYPEHYQAKGAEERD